MPGLVAFGCSAVDKMEAIRLGSDMLKKLGYVTDGFVDSVIKREMAVSTEVGFGFAIPHGSPEGDVLAFKDCSGAPRQSLGIIAFQGGSGLYFPVSGLYG